MKRLAVCDELEHSSCGSLLFYCRIDPPVFDLMPTGEEVNHTPQPQLPLGLKTGENGLTISEVCYMYTYLVCVLMVREHATKLDNICFATSRPSTTILQFGV